MINKISERKRLQTIVRDLTHNYRQRAEREINQELIKFFRTQIPGTIGLYLNQEHEVSTKFIINWLFKHNWEVYAPKIKGQEMQFFSVPQGGESLIWEKNFQLWEPPVHGKMLTKFNVMLIPIVGYNDNGYRLGHGQGYYDRWLAKHPQKFTIGLAYHEQRVDSNLTFNHYDIPVHRIITNKNQKGKNDKRKS